QGVELAQEADDWPATAGLGHEGGGHAGEVAGDLEACSLQDRDLGGRGFHLFEAKLGEVPHVVADFGVDVSYIRCAPGDPRPPSRTILHLRLDRRVTGHECTPSRSVDCTEPSGSCNC